MSFTFGLISTIYYTSIMLCVLTYFAYVFLSIIKSIFFCINFPFRIVVKSIHFSMLFFAIDYAF